MSSTDTKQPQESGRGPTVDANRIRAAIFRLVSIIHASIQYPRMYQSRSNGWRSIGDGGDETIALIAENAEPELIENLLLIAASLRVHNERMDRKLLMGSAALGYLTVDGTRDKLTIKDACDKIIHADDLRFGGGTEPYEARPFGRELPGPFVVQTVHLTGKLGKQNWTADMDLGVYCNEAARLTLQI
jgi:hypothetical protein